MPHNRRSKRNLRGWEIHDVRVLLSTYDSRGGIEPLAALGVRLRQLGAEAVVCGPPDCAERLAEVGLPLVPAGDPVRGLVHRATPPSPDDMPRLIGELIATWFDTVAPAAAGCDAMVGSGVIPAAVGARSVAEKLGIPFAHVHYCPVYLPSPHHAPPPLPGPPLPADVTDNWARWELNARQYNEIFGPALNRHRVANGLSPVDNVRDYLHGDHPWLAADPVLAPWPGPASTGPAELGVVQTGAWILPDQRPLPAELEVVVPQWGDQPYFAGRVAELGIGAAHAVQAPTTESLAAALGIALDLGTRARAKAVAGTIRTDGTTVAAELLFSSATA
jgi:vancomycin aglycone glucosyltransferase